MKKGTYIASRASIPERAEAWKKLRDEGYIISSSWIDAEPNNTDVDFSELWVRITKEVAFSEILIVYAEPDDFPLKGTLVEVGIAIASNIPIFVVVPNVVIEQGSFRPIGSWINHPLVTVVPDMATALVKSNKK